MKPLIIIDFSHTCARMLHTAIANAKPSVKKGLYVSDEWVPYFNHLVFNSLQFVKNKFGGEVIIAMDSSNNWRKDFYPEYKAHRAKTRDASKIAYEDYYNAITEIAEALRSYFPFKVLKVPKSEADDIAGTLSNTYGNERNIILVTSDKDWKQVMAENSKVRMWDPIKRDFQSISEYERTQIQTPQGLMSRFTVHHTLLGDSGDNVPSLTGMTEFSDNFISFLKSNQVYTSCPREFNEMSIKEILLEKYDVYKITKSGANKGKPKEEKDIYRTVPFGKTKAEKASDCEVSLNQLLAKHRLYGDAFKRNAILVDFSEIPDYLQNNIKEAYINTEVNYDTNGMLNYFIESGLDQMVHGINKFYDSSYESKKSSSLDDFF